MAYTRISPVGDSVDPTSETVRFVDYDSCPAMVIVLTDDGKKFRCLRDEIFSGDDRIPIPERKSPVNLK
jgi:hypothetical protein